MSWLLVAANNFLRHRRADRAIVLLELLGLLDPNHLQGRMMLAYAHWLLDDRPRCAALLESVLQQPLSDGDRAAMDLMRRRLGATAADPHASSPPPGRA